MGKKNNRLSKVEAVSRLDRMMPIIHRNVVNAIRIEATMKVGNNIVSTMPNKTIPGAVAFNVIMQSLAFDLAMHLARLYDLGNQKRHVNKRDVASIPLAVRLLRQKRCQQELKSRARNGPSHEPSFEDLFETDCAKAISRASENYTETFKGKYGRGGLRSLKDFRNIFMAHSLMTDKDVKLIYNQLFRLKGCACDFVGSAMPAVSGKDPDLDGHEKNSTDNAEAFWRMALLGEREEEI